MYYPDLSPMRLGLPGQIATVYPDIVNVGWLEGGHEFPRGSVSSETITKLKEILFIPNKNIEDKKAGKFNPERAILIDYTFVRGPPHLCTLCKHEPPCLSEDQVKWMKMYDLKGAPIFLKPDGLRLYNGEKKLLLGIGYFKLPGVDMTKLYCFPSMILHYITDHNYLPPDEFIRAIEAFSLTNPYNPVGFHRATTSYQKLYDEIDRM